MGEGSAIGWTHNTFNCWWGCVEVSPECDDCYARELSLRYGYEVWGHDGPRRFFGDQHWNDPIRWNRRAEKTGRRERTFCMSMADIGEERSDDVGREMDRARERLYPLILATPYLDWLLLTKRGSFFRRRVPREILDLPNVWPGVTVGLQPYAWRMDELARVECAGPKWVSYEPSLGAVDFRPYLPRIEWVIGGGKSGAKLDGRIVEYSGGRWLPVPEALAWMRDARDQCVAAGTAFYFKQWGGPRPASGGRELDGRTWDEFPRQTTGGA